MARINTMTLAMLALLSAITTTTTILAQSDFAPVEPNGNTLSSDEQAKVIGIRLPPHCPTDALDLQVPDVQFTIMPSSSDAIVVLTSPTNVVTTRLGTADDGAENLMDLEWNPTLSELEGTSLGGVGVIIQIPNAQFQKFYSCCNSSAQIFEGFTNLVDIQLASGSNTQAILSSDDSAANPSIIISEKATAVIERDLGFNNVMASYSSVLSLRGDIWGSLEGSVNAAITLKGSLQSGATSSLLTSSASFTTTTSDDCEKIQVTDGATCTIASEGDSLEVSAALGSDLALGDTGKRTTCVPRPVGAQTWPSGGGSSGGSGGAASSAGFSTVTTTSTVLWGLVQPLSSSSLFLAMTTAWLLATTLYS